MTLRWAMSGWLVALSQALAPAVASAELGGKIDTVETDRKFYGATRHSVTTSDHYTVHEATADGLTIREYAGKDGVVFAVAWQGITQPDLSAILGHYFGEYQETLQQSPKVRGRRAHATVRGANVIVEKYGHMRAMGGRAYLAQLPPGVQLDDIH